MKQWKLEIEGCPPPSLQSVTENQSESPDVTPHSNGESGSVDESEESSTHGCDSIELSSSSEL